MAIKNVNRDELLG